MLDVDRDGREDLVIGYWKGLAGAKVVLDVYLREAAGEDAEAAVINWGQALKDLAAANIFTGDILAKNFGVTRHGRVVSYDYDELRPLTECNFRRFPESRGYDDELADSPWFSVADKPVARDHI